MSAMKSVKEAIANIDRTVLGYMALNFFSATFIIFTNKVVFRTYEFKFATFITACHFVATYAGILYCKQQGMYTSKKLDHFQVLPITCAFLGFVIFNNLSLQYNSVGFYQLMKVLTTPVIALIQWYGYGTKLSKNLQYALVPVIVGVALATVSDMQTNFTGTCFAVLGIVSTSYYQIFVKTKQKSLDANSFQVLEYQAPQAAILAGVMSVPLDGISMSHNPLTTQWSFGLFVAVCASCALAFLVNLSIFLVVGKTDPISYNVMGHMKLLVILTGGIMLFGDDTNSLRLFGMFLAFVGIVSYTHIKLTAPAQPAQPASGAKQPAKEMSNSVA